MAYFSDTRKLRVVMTSSKGVTELDNKYISELLITKSMNEKYGSFTITMRPDFYGVDFVANAEVNTLIDISINNTLIMQGIMLRPTFSGVMGNQSRNVVLRGFDYGYLFTDVNTPYGQFTDNFIKAEAEATVKLATIYAKNRKISGLVPDIYERVLGAVQSINNGQSYTFADGKTMAQKFGPKGQNALLLADDSTFYVDTPISIQLLTEGLTLRDVVSRVADPSFSDVYGITLNNGDSVGLGKVMRYVGNSGWRMVVRPKVFGKYWLSNARVNIDKNYQQISAMKDGSSIYNWFVVGNSGWGWDASVGEATGQYVSFPKSIVTFGYKPMKIDIISTKEDSSLTALLSSLALEVSSWYKDAEHFISGQIVMPWDKDVVIGKNVVFTMPDTDTTYMAYIEQVDVKVTQTGMTSTIAYTRGRKYD